MFFEPIKEEKDLKISVFYIQESLFCLSNSGSNSSSSTAAITATVAKVITFFYESVLFAWQIIQLAVYSHPFKQRKLIESE